MFEEYDGKDVKIFLLTGKVYTIKNAVVNEEFLEGLDLKNEFVTISKKFIGDISTISGTQPVKLQEVKNDKQI